MKRVHLFLIFVCIVSYCSNTAIFAQDTVKEESLFSISKENLDALLFEGPESVKEQTGMDFSYTTEADLISGSGLNKLVNVRVYLHLNNQKRLISSDNVAIKNFETATISDLGSTCSGYLADGNYVVEDENRNQNFYCLYEILNKNRFIYDHYRMSLHQFFQ